MSTPDPLAYRAELLRHARRLVGPDDIDDLVQDVYVAFYARPYQERGAIRAWLHTVLTRRAIDLARRRRNEQRRLMRVWEPITSRDPAEIALARLVCHEVLGRAPLTARTRRATQLHYGAGYSLRETADQMGTTPGAAKRLCERGLRSIRTGRPVW